MLYCAPNKILRRLLLSTGAKMFRCANLSAAALVGSLALSGPVSLRAQAPDSQDSSNRPITVADAIEMTRLADPDYLRSGSSKGHVAQFSPDGQKFVVILRKGNFEKNVNEFSLLLFQTADVFHSPKPDRLLTMSSSSNRDAIHALKWLGDNETIAFLGENPGQASQVYTFDLKRRKLEKLTNSATAITSYDITTDGRQVIFLADLPPKRVAESE